MKEKNLAALKKNIDNSGKITTEKHTKQTLWDLKNWNGDRLMKITNFKIIIETTHKLKLKKFDVDRSK